MASKICNNCQFAIMTDFGYSNYTVEGTTFVCGKQIHPNGEFDRWYGEDERLQYAEQCTGYEDGGAIHIDVDRDVWTELSESQRLILANVGINPPHWHV
jgi:hypothetical protein